MDHEQIITSINWLIDDWCEVRKLAALRHVLPVYATGDAGFTEWVRLREALLKVLSSCAAELSEVEKASLKKLIAALEGATA
jgi:hypothetical protein